MLKEVKVEPVQPGAVLRPAWMDKRVTALCDAIGVWKNLIREDGGPKKRGGGHRKPWVRLASELRDDQKLAELTLRAVLDSLVTTADSEIPWPSLRAVRKRLSREISAWAERYAAGVGDLDNESAPQPRRLGTWTQVEVQKASIGLIGLAKEAGLVEIDSMKVTAVLSKPGGPKTGSSTLVRLSLDGEMEMLRLASKVRPSGICRTQPTSPIEVRKGKNCKGQSTASPKALAAAELVRATPWQVNVRALNAYVALLSVKRPGVYAAFLAATGDSLSEQARLTDDEARHVLAGVKRAARNEYKAQSAELIRLNTLLWMHDQGKFWLDVRFDYRGRLYQVGPLSYTSGSDEIRGCLEFADARKATTEGGLRRLRRHVLNQLLGSSAPVGIGEEAQWIEEHIPKIREYIASPSEHCEWMDAAEPVQFWAACDALLRAENGEAIGLPVGVDQSASSLQHYACLLRDKDLAAAVNILEDNPRDFYGEIAEELAKEYGAPILRKMVKAVLMPADYGSGSKSDHKALRAVWKEKGPRPARKYKKLVLATMEKYAPKKSSQRFKYAPAKHGETVEVLKKNGKPRDAVQIVRRKTVRASGTCQCGHAMNRHLDNGLFGERGCIAHEFPDGPSSQCVCPAFTPLYPACVQKGTYTCPLIRIGEFQFFQVPRFEEEIQKDSAKLGQKLDEKIIAFIASEIRRRAIERRRSVIELRRWLRDAADVLAGYAPGEAGKGDGCEISWVTPSGFSVVQDKRHPKNRLKVRGPTVSLAAGSRVQVDEYTPGGPVDHGAQKTSLAPNIVHSLDASVLHMALADSTQWGRSIAVAHDCFATHADNTDELCATLRRVVREVHEKSFLFKLRDQWIKLQRNQRTGLQPARLGDCFPASAPGASLKMPDPPAHDAKLPEEFMQGSWAFS